MVTAQFDEHLDLGAQNFGDDGLKQKIHGAQVVAAEQLLVAFVAGEEKDRGVARAFAGANQLGSLKAVHLGHLDVQKNGGEIVFQQMAQGLHAGRGQNQFLRPVRPARLRAK